jgi:uncharacterized protein YutE (UPF0331/DUF86 family)
MKMTTTTDTRRDRVASAVATLAEREKAAMEKALKVRERLRVAKQKLATMEARQDRAARTAALCDLGAAFVNIFNELPSVKRDNLLKLLENGLTEKQLQRRQQSISLLLRREG